MGSYVECTVFKCMYNEETDIKKEL